MRAKVVLNEVQCACVGKKYQRTKLEDYSENKISVDQTLLHLRLNFFSRMSTVLLSIKTSSRIHQFLSNHFRYRDMFEACKDTG